MPPVCHQPRSLDDAMRLRAANPGAQLINGGTDVMVGINFGRSTPEVLLDLSRVPELQTWTEHGSGIRIGAGVTYSRIMDELGQALPGLAAASRTVGSQQIRNRATIGGNLGTASPAGDALPPLLASRATVELHSPSSIRTVPVADFLIGPGKTVLGPDELVTVVNIPAGGHQQFAKVGRRNAMVISLASVAISVDPAHRRVGFAIGSAAPTAIVAAAAESYAHQQLDWNGRTALDPDVRHEFAELAIQAIAPIDDVRSTAAYRRHVVGVLSARALSWAWQDFRKAGQPS